MSDDEGSATREAASAYLVEWLHVEGYLSREAYDRARELLWPADTAWAWFQRGLLFTGAALVAAGVAYLFVSKWPAIPAYAKFALLEVTIAGACGYAIVRGLDDIVGKISLMGASVLVGAFLVVVGAVYPTGAEAWQLFRGWALLVVPFVLLGRFQPHWLLWVALVDAAVTLFWLQAVPWESRAGFSAVMAGVGLYNGAVLALREASAQLSDAAWLGSVWPRWVLLGASAAYLSVPVWLYVTLAEPAPTSIPLGTTVVWATVVGGAAIYFRSVDFDLVALTIVGLAAGSVPTIAAMARIVRHTSLSFSLLAAGLLVFATTAFLVAVLRRMAASDRRDRRHLSEGDRGG